MFIICLLASEFLYSQVYNYKGINIQGQHDFGNGGQISFNFVIISFSGDTLWQEEHNDVQLTPENSYNVMMGLGNYISGTETLFETINWFDVDKVEIVRTSVPSSYLIAEFEPITIPYSFHSLTIQYIPFTYELIDVLAGNSPVGYLYKFDGLNFYLAQDLLADTVNFSWTTGTASFADTVSMGISNQSIADTSNFTFDADTSNFASNILNSSFADTTMFSDTSGVAYYSAGNWGIDGNSGLNTSNFAGTNNAVDFSFGTNSSSRLTFGNGNQIHNGFPTIGYHINTNDGVLFQTNTNSQIQELSGSYFYFNGVSRATGMAYSSIPRGVDSLQADYSFHFGEDVSSSGKYSVIFGKNSRADSSITSSTLYEPVSSFAFGRNCIVSRYGVAIGDSAIANYYRNVAIGHNVIANTGSAATAIGNNVLATGATSWGAGKNIQVTGNFSTGLGTNASTNGFFGSFVYGDNSTTDTVFNTANHQFMVRANGGVFIYSSSDLSTGVQVSAGGGAWSMVSDKNKKENIKSLNYLNYAYPIINIPIYSWTYKNTKTFHIGPMAQDFYSSFCVGELSNYINMIDIDGVTLLGIKLVSEKLDEELIPDQVDHLEQDINDEKKEFEELQNRINVLYEKMDN